MIDVGQILHGNTDIHDEGSDAVRKAVQRAELEMAIREDGLIDDALLEASAAYGKGLMAIAPPLAPEPLL